MLTPTSVQTNTDNFFYKDNPLTFSNSNSMGSTKRIDQDFSSQISPDPLTFAIGLLSSKIVINVQEEQNQPRIFQKEFDNRKITTSLTERHQALPIKLFGKTKQSKTKVEFQNNQAKRQAYAGGGLGIRSPQAPRSPTLNNNVLVPQYAKLMSISDGLRNNILPKTQDDINLVYSSRIKKYMNLIAIHGQSNMGLVNTMFGQPQHDNKLLQKIHNQTNNYKKLQDQYQNFKGQLIKKEQVKIKEHKIEAVIPIPNRKPKKSHSQTRTFQKWFSETEFSQKMQNLGKKDAASNTQSPHLQDVTFRNQEPFMKIEQQEVQTPPSQVDVNIFDLSQRQSKLNYINVPPVSSVSQLSSQEVSDKGAHTIKKTEQCLSQKTTLLIRQGTMKTNPPRTDNISIESHSFIQDQESKNQTLNSNEISPNLMIASPIQSIKKTITTDGSAPYFLKDAKQNMRMIKKGLNKNLDSDEFLKKQFNNLQDPEAPISPLKHDILLQVKEYPVNICLPAQKLSQAQLLKSSKVNTQFRNPVFKSNQRLTSDFQDQRSSTPTNYKTFKANNQLYVIKNNGEFINDLTSFDQPQPTSSNRQSSYLNQQERAILPKRHQIEVQPKNSRITSQRSTLMKLTNQLQPIVSQGFSLNQDRQVLYDLKADSKKMSIVHEQDLKLISQESVEESLMQPMDGNQNQKAAALKQQLTDNLMMPILSSKRSSQVNQSKFEQNLYKDLTFLQEDSSVERDLLKEQHNYRLASKQIRQLPLCPSFKPGKTLNRFFKRSNVVSQRNSPPKKDVVSVFEVYQQTKSNLNLKEIKRFSPNLLRISQHLNPTIRLVERKRSKQMSNLTSLDRALAHINTANPIRRCIPLEFNQSIV